MLPLLAAAVAAVVPYFVDARLSPEDSIAVDAAFVEWNLALNGAQFFVHAPEERPCPWLVWPDQVTVTAEMPWSRPDNWLAWVGQVGGNDIHLIDFRIGNMRMRAVALHEIGHVLGLPDDREQVGTLMFLPYEMQAHCVDSVTLDELARLRGWPRAALRTTCQ